MDELFGKDNLLRLDRRELLAGRHVRVPRGRVGTAGLYGLAEILRSRQISATFASLRAGRRAACGVRADPARRTGDDHDYSVDALRSPGPHARTLPSVTYWPVGVRRGSSADLVALVIDAVDRARVEGR